MTIGLAGGGVRTGSAPAKRTAEVKAIHPRSPPKRVAGLAYVPVRNRRRSVRSPKAPVGDGRAVGVGLRGSFVETEASGRFRGGGGKRIEEPHLSCGIEGGDQSPIRHLTGRGQKRKAVSMA